MKLKVERCRSSSDFILPKKLCVRAFKQNDLNREMLIFLAQFLCICPFEHFELKKSILTRIWKRVFDLLYLYETSARLENLPEAFYVTKMER